MTKAELRQLYKQKRSAISTKEKLKLDDLMLIQFQKLSFSDVYVLLTYWPFTKYAEPNTHLYSGYLRHSVPGLTITYPVINNSNFTMQAFSIDEETVYKQNEYGIHEPDDGELINPIDIDIVFVPMLVCDAQGYRVGYGKGYYDRFLANCKADVICIGFNYFNPVDEVTDKQPFDIPLNYCITPESVYEF